MKEIASSLGWLLHKTLMPIWAETLFNKNKQETKKEKEIEIINYSESLVIKNKDPLNWIQNNCLI